MQVTDPAANSKANARHAVLAGFFGWTLDAFDFFVVVFMYDVLARQFGVSKKDIIFTTFATLAMRPVGAAIFGVLSDRYGRRRPLMANVIYFSLIELLCGFSPNFTFFLVMRALFGIAPSRSTVDAGIAHSSSTTLERVSDLPRSWQTL